MLVGNEPDSVRYIPDYDKLGTLWNHWKGGPSYRIIGFTWNSETDRWMYRYQGRSNVEFTQTPERFHEDVFTVTGQSVREAPEGTSGSKTPRFAPA